MSHVLIECKKRKEKEKEKKKKRKRKNNACSSVLV